jgi:hypothetical protein
MRSLAERVAEKIEVLLYGPGRAQGSAARELTMWRNCRCDDKRLSSMFVLGVILVALAEKGDAETALEVEAPEFVSEVQDA